MLDQSDWRGRLAHQPWNKHITARYDRINNLGYTGAPAKSATVHITVRTVHITVRGVPPLTAPPPPRNHSSTMMARSKSSTARSR